MQLQQQTSILTLNLRIKQDLFLTHKDPESFLLQNKIPVLQKVPQTQVDHRIHVLYFSVTLSPWVLRG